MHVAFQKAFAKSQGLALLMCRVGGGIWATMAQQVKHNAFVGSAPGQKIQ